MLFVCTHSVPDGACVVVDSKLRCPLLWLLVVRVLLVLLVALVHKGVISSLQRQGGDRCTYVHVVGLFWLNNKHLLHPLSRSTQCARRHRQQ